MIIKSAELETVCGITSRLPENELPEFAFAGKSNVGKSSLINALMNRKSLARTSSQPGKTQTINFYLINQNMYYVDLPGYGYAKVSVEVKAKWGKMIERYLRSSKALKCVFLLIDIRHEPSANDRMMYDWIVGKRISSGDHSHEAGQDQAEPDGKAGEADPGHPGHGKGRRAHPLLCGDKAGKRGDLGLPGGISGTGGNSGCLPVRRGGDEIGRTVRITG